MHKFTNTLTPAQVYRYAVECCQPHLKLRDAKRVTARMLLTILFAAAARISSLSDTCKRLRGVPDEEVVAAVLYETLPDYNLLKRQVNAALAGRLPKPLRKQAQIVALDLTLLPLRRRRQGERPDLSQPGQAGHLFLLRLRLGVHRAQGAALHSCAHGGHPQADDGGRDQGIAPPSPQGRDSLRFLVLDRGFYSVAVIRYLQAAQMPFLMPVVGHGRTTRWAPAASRSSRR